MMIGSFGFSQKLKCTGISMITTSVVSIQELWDWIFTYSERYLGSQFFVGLGAISWVVIKCSFLYSNRQSDNPAVIGPVCGGVKYYFCHNTIPVSMIQCTETTKTCTRQTWWEIKEAAECSQKESITPSFCNQTSAAAPESAACLKFSSMFWLPAAARIQLWTRVGLPDSGRNCFCLHPWRPAMIKP